MRRLAGHRIAFFAALLLAANAAAQTLILKNGQTETGKSFQRRDDAVVLSIEITAPDGKKMTSERSIPLAEIERVEAAPPAIFAAAAAQFSAGKASAVLTEAEAAEKAAEPFGELPGSWWAQAVVLEAHALLALGKDAQAAAVVAKLEKSTSEELKNDVKAVQALIAARKGDFITATPLAAPLCKDGTPPRTLAAASVARGLSYLAKKEFINALKAFLELPVFTPDETALAAAAQLGVAQAYFGLEDYDRAIASLEEVSKKQPTSPEAVTARTLLPQWIKRRTAVKDAKAADQPQ